MSRVLIIEPDRLIRNLIAGILTDFGHDVRQCRDAHDAAECLRTARFDALVTDLSLGDSAEGIVMLTLNGGRHPAPPHHAGPFVGLRDKPFRITDLKNLVAATAALDVGRLLAA